LRRATIAQFARIADAIEEDEVIGFGLYLTDGDDPAEWRCLSRRDALRITEEIRVLLGAGESGQESHLPAVADVNSGARYLFGRRERNVETAKLAGAVREVEASLSKRLSRLEGEVADHSGHIQDLRAKSVEAEQSMGRLLSAVEGFCEQAASRLETVTAPALAAAAAPSSIEAPIEAPVEAKSELETSAPARPPAPAETSSRPEVPLRSETPAAALPLWGTSSVTTAEPFTERRSAWWRSPTAISVALGAAVILLGMLLWPSSSPSPSGPGNQVTSAAEPAASTPAPGPAPVEAVAPTPALVQPAPKSTKTATTAPTSTTPPQAAETQAPAVPKASPPAVVGATRIELEATEPSWISIRGGDGTTQMARLIEPGNIQSVDIREPAVLRTGNAGGLTIRSNGKSLGPLGPHGVVREVEFKDGEFKLVPIK
jgi:hypothetical protein